MGDHSHAVCQKGKRKSYMVGSRGRCHRVTSCLVQSHDLRPLSGFELHLVNLPLKLTAGSLN